MTKIGKDKNNNTVSFKKAVNGIIEELNIQNEKEKELNIPITKFYGQNDTRSNINECEALFIEEIALPLYKHLSEAIPQVSDLSVLHFLITILY